MMKRQFAMLLFFGLAAMARAETPTTKPAGKPDATVTIENRAYSFHYAVPKAWTVKQKSDKTTVFNLPSKTGAYHGLFIVLTGTPVKDGAKLEDIVAGKKQAIEARNRESKYTNDSAVTLDGERAWRIEYQFSEPAKQTTSVNGKPADVKEVMLMHQTVDVMCVRGKAVVEIMYVTIAENFAAHIDEVEAALASFKWADDAAGPAAKDNK